MKEITVLKHNYNIWNKQHYNFTSSYINSCCIFLNKHLRKKVSMLIVFSSMHLSWKGNHWLLQNLTVVILWIGRLTMELWKWGSRDWECPQSCQWRKKELSTYHGSTPGHVADATKRASAEMSICLVASFCGVTSIHWPIMWLCISW